MCHPTEKFLMEKYYTIQFSSGQTFPVPTHPPPPLQHLCTNLFSGLFAIFRKAAKPLAKRRGNQNRYPCAVNCKKAGPTPSKSTSAISQERKKKLNKTTSSSFHIQMDRRAMCPPATKGWARAVSCPLRAVYTVNSLANYIINCYSENWTDFHLR